MRIKHIKRQNSEITACWTLMSADPKTIRLLMREICDVLTDIVKNRLFMPVPAGNCIYEYLSDNSIVITVSLKSFNESDVDDDPEFFKDCMPAMVNAFMLRFAPSMNGVSPVWCKAVPAFRSVCPWVEFPTPQDEIMDEYLMVTDIREIRNLLDALYDGEVTHHSAIER